MQITNRRALVLGGAGLVGMAICRELLPESPDEIIVASLKEGEAAEACDVLSSEQSFKTILTPVGGDIFLRDALQGVGREQILHSSEARQMLIDDVLGDFTEDVLNRSFLFQLVKRFRPHIIIDCVNSATAVAYQDIFKSYFKLTSDLAGFRQNKKLGNDFVDDVEKLLCTLYVPQLIRHVQILYEAMRRVKTDYYFKIGTSGTGGMGLNIPYTHSEEKPSRMLLSKSSIAGAHTMLLFLMARTPDAPITKEIKPTAAIAWKKIEYGDIRRGGKTIQLYDCPPEAGVVLNNTIKLKDDSCAEKLEGKTLKSVYVDTGENGIFSQAEFEAISSSGQMELITPEEIAKSVLFEIKGGNTGHDVINALDNATMGPTYRAGLMRQRALEQMRELMEQHKADSVAFELLGPPRLSKLLYEGHLFRLCFGSLQALSRAKPEDLSQKLEERIVADQQLRAQIISIGVPILLPDGERLLRGRDIKIPAYRGESEIEISVENIDQWAYDGWVDLRVKNMEAWKNRAQKIYKEIRGIPEDDSSSKYDRNRRFWLEDEEINIGKVAGWILANEEHGSRMKA